MSYNAKMLREFMKLMHKRGGLSDKELAMMLDALKVNQDFNTVVNDILGDDVWGEVDKEATTFIAMKKFESKYEWLTGRVIQFDPANMSGDFAECLVRICDNALTYGERPVLFRVPKKSLRKVTDGSHPFEFNGVTVQGVDHLVEPMLETAGGSIFTIRGRMQS